MQRGNSQGHRNLNNLWGLSNMSNQNLNQAYVRWIERNFPNFVRSRRTPGPRPGNTNIAFYNRAKFLITQRRRSGAATKIQTHWRGYKTRQNIRYPRPNTSKAVKKMAFMEKRNNKTNRRYDPSKHRSRTGLENVRRLFK
jgi:hypothetical protein